MADAPDSKSGRGNPVGVQVPPPAPLDPLGSIDQTNFYFPLTLSRGTIDFPSN